jgi:hypothetical protein
MIDTNHPVNYFMCRVSENLEVLFLPIVLFFVPVQGILITVAAVVFLDTVTGIWKALKKGIQFSSRGLSALGSKLLLYESVLLCSYLVDAFILGDVLLGMFSIENMVTKVSSLIFLTIEVISINENFKAVRGISMLDALKKLVTRAKEAKEVAIDITKTPKL